MRQVFKYIAADGTVTHKVRYKVDGRSGSKTFPTHADAEAFNELIDRFGIKRALAFIKEPTEPKHIASGATVAECVTDYIELLPNRSTREAYMGWAKSSIIPRLGDIRINQLTSADVQRWLNNQDVSSGTIRRNLKLLRASLNAAIKRREIIENPTQGVAVPRRPRNEKRAPLTPPFSREEYGLIRKAMHPHYQLFVEFLAESGCRFGEAAALTPADINLAAGTVHFNKSYSPLGNTYALGNTKTEESDRIIKVDRSLLERLELSGQFVFTTQRGDRIKGNAFRAYHWKRAIQEAGLPVHRWGHPHDLRHAHATWLLDNGVSPHAVQKRLGHRNVMTTMTMYGHPAANSEEQILAVLDGLRSPSAA